MWSEEIGDRAAYVGEGGTGGRGAHINGHNRTQPDTTGHRPDTQTGHRRRISDTLHARTRVILITVQKTHRTLHRGHYRWYRYRCRYRCRYRHLRIYRIIELQLSND
jgi:hypothetical protein